MGRSFVLANEAIAGAATPSRVRRGLAWSCTLVASLELAKQGDLTLAQDALYQQQLYDLRNPVTAYTAGGAGVQSGP